MRGPPETADPSMDALETVSVRVLELGGAPGGIASAYAGWLLQRLGARVTRCVPEEAAAAQPITDPENLALHALAQGKTACDWPQHAAQLDHLLAACDVLLAETSSVPACWGSIDELQGRHPRLVIGIASVFGRSGPYAGFPATALDAQALSGTAWALGEPGRAPLSLPPGIFEHQAGAMLAAGCLAAVTFRDATGRGQVVDVALADVLASYVAGNCRFYIHHGLQWQRSGRRASGSGGAYPFVILPCKDGDVCICGRTRDEWNRLITVMGNPEWASLPRYQDLRAMGKHYPEEGDAFLAPWLAQHTQAELARLALENGLIVAPVRAFADIIETPQFAARDFFETVQVGAQTLRTPGLPFRVLETRRDDAPNLAATLLDFTVEAPRGAPEYKKVRTASSADPSTARGPLAGLRVVDFGWVWSAPWVSTMLAELGAEVIKVEHAARPDNLRMAGRVFRDGVMVEGPSREMSPMYHQINHGKLGITLNLKDPRAVALAKRLVAMSDLVVENMSPGAMERSGLGFADLHAVNPRLVMLAMSAAGQFGPLKDLRAYAPTMSSFVGLEGLVGYPGEPPIGALNIALGDPNGSTHALAVTFAALRRARATGRGCYIDFSQVEALLGILRPYLLEAQCRGARPCATGNRHPQMAPHGIYPALGEDRWLSIAVTGDAQWSALTRLASGASFAGEERFATAAGRLAHVDDLDTQLAAWTAHHDRDALVATLRAAGVAASPVQSIHEVWTDPHFGARGLRHGVQIPWYGEEQLWRAPWSFSESTPLIDAPGPTTGQHNAQVFGDLLGLSGEEIATLVEAGVIA